MPTWSCAIEGAADGIFANSGQVCVANSRLYAHQRRVRPRGRGHRRAAPRRSRSAPGIDPDTEMGPLVSQEQLDRVSALLKSGAAARAHARSSAASRLDRDGLLRAADRAGRRQLRHADHARGDLRPGDLRARRSTTTTWSGSPTRPTTPPTAWPPTSGRATSAPRTRWPPSSRPARYGQRRRRSRPAVRRLQAVRVGP